MNATILPNSTRRYRVEVETYVVIALAGYVSVIAATESAAAQQARLAVDAGNVMTTAEHERKTVAYSLGAVTLERL